MLGLRFVSFSLFLLLSTSMAFGQDTPVESKKPAVGIGVSFKFLGLDVSSNDYLRRINNVPVELRQVPSHPNDTWIYGSRQVVRTIPYDSVEIGATAGTIFALSPELTVWRFRARSGLSFYMGSPGGGPTKGNEGSTREINQHGKPERGYGTSLVYYSIYGRASRKPGLTNEVDLNIAKDIILIAGYGWNGYKLMAESGYDRYDALEKYKTYEVASSRRTKRYFGFGWRPDADGQGWQPITLSLVAGKSLTSTRLTEAGRGMTLEYGNPWFFEFSFSAQGFLWNK